MDGGLLHALCGFVRYGGDAGSRADDSSSGDEDTEENRPDARRGELFVDAGVEVEPGARRSQRRAADHNTPVGTGPHLGIGARRAVTQNNDLGVRAEFDSVDGHSLIGVRALDYRHRFGDAFAAGLFVGVDRYNLATPAYSIYYGLGVQWRNLLPDWDLGLDFRHGQYIARDKVLPTDIQGPRPDSFYTITSGVLYLSRHF